MGLITKDQLSAYQENGYLILENFIFGADCDRLVKEAQSLVDAFQPKEEYSIFSTYEQERITNDYFLNSSDKIRFFFEAGAFSPEKKLRQEKSVSINKIGHALHDLNPVFNAFSRQPKVASLCADLGLSQPLLMQSMYIFKQPHIGGEVTCHQDSTFLYTEPLSTIGLWFALQDATIENGCLYVLPGGHKKGLKRRFVRNESGGTCFIELDPTPWPEAGYRPLEAKRGTLVILDGLVPHLSGANTSSSSRHAYTLHLVEGKSHYPLDNWLQRTREFPAKGF